MPTTTMSSNGRINVPHVGRTALGLHAGTKLHFVPVADGFKLAALHKPEASTLKGRFAGRVDKAVSLRAMDEAIAAEAALRHATVRGKRGTQWPGPIPWRSRSAGL